MNSNREFRRSSPFWTWIPLIVFAGIASIFAITYFFGAFPNAGGYLRFYYFPWWVILPLFFFGLFFCAFRWWGGAYRWGSRGYYYDGDPALGVLRERFARGEITREQYDQMRKDLEAS